MDFFSLGRAIFPLARLLLLFFRFLFCCWSHVVHDVDDDDDNTLIHPHYTYKFNTFVLLAVRE